MSISKVMPAITSVVLGAFAAYAGLWYLGRLEGNFALFLFLATVVTGLYWLAERAHFLPQRQRAAAELEAQVRQRREALDKQGLKHDGAADVAQAQASLLMQPWWLDWTAGLFPVILVVFLLRSFLYEPFKIPSESMVPTLLVGDLILVNKFTYGLRLPVINTKITEGTPPKRGDVMVFRYPPQPSLDYIKRVVGLPGDEVAYLNKKLTVNGQPVDIKAAPDFFSESMVRYVPQYDEKLGDVSHRILVDVTGSAALDPGGSFPFRENCRYSVEGVVCKVPPGHYFMMGDNRDNSQDSRYWGFVPDKNIVGKAFFIWMNFSSPGRIGAFH